MMELNDTNDIEEFAIQDNIQGALIQLGILTEKMQQATSIYPPTMGQAPRETKKTATAIATGEKSTDRRTNYKSTTFEYTFLNELYWIILQMTDQHATPDQGIELMGDKVYNFNPGMDFFYKPLSQSIDSENTKWQKAKQWITILGYVAQMQHPDAPLIFNYAMSKVVVLMGDEFENFADKLLNPDKPMVPPDQGGGGSPEDPGYIEGTSNEQGIQMGAGESMAREGASAV